MGKLVRLEYIITDANGNEVQSLGYGVMGVVVWLDGTFTNVGIAENPNQFTDYVDNILNLGSTFYIPSDNPYKDYPQRYFPIANSIDLPNEYVGSTQHKLKLKYNDNIYALSVSTLNASPLQFNLAINGALSSPAYYIGGSTTTSGATALSYYCWGVSEMSDNGEIPTTANFYRLQTNFVSGPPFSASGYSVASNNIKSRFFEWFNSMEGYVVPKDPYAQGGESDTGGGEGNFDGTSVDVDFASLPTLSAVDTGFISLYNPTLAQLQSLANYMWSDLFDIDTFKKLFGDPMQAILGLSIVPGPVPSSGAQVVKVGNISTGISINRAASQYIDIDCGTLNVEEFWGAYLDYEPYTKAEIYLPYIGTHQIAVDDIMGKAVHIKYHIDILSGGCACEIKCGGSVLYTFIGSCAVSIPVTGSDWTNLLNGVLSAASAIGTMVATGGAAAPAAAGEIASAAVNSLKPNIEKSGSVSGGGGLMAGKVPVLILTRPRQALPASQNEFTGYPAFITRSLGAVSGYTEVHKIRLGGIPATDVELSEIERLLKGGVIL